MRELNSFYLSFTHLGDRKYDVACLIDSSHLSQLSPSSLFPIFLFAEFIGEKGRIKGEKERIKGEKGRIKGEKGGLKERRRGLKERRRGLKERRRGSKERRG